MLEEANFSFGPFTLLFLLDFLHLGYLLWFKKFIFDQTISFASNLQIKFDDIPLFIVNIFADYYVL